MTFSDFVPSEEYKKFEAINGEDTFIKLNLLYIAFEMSDIYDEESNSHGAFDELCEDVLEIYLDEQFESYNVIDVADAVVFIIKDSNYTVAEYEITYKRKREKIIEELLAYLESTRLSSVDYNDGEDDSNSENDDDDNDNDNNNYK